MSRALGSTCWAWASDAWARRRASLHAGEEDDETLQTALFSIPVAIVALLCVCERESVCAMTEMGIGCVRKGRRDGVGWWGLIKRSLRGELGRLVGVVWELGKWFVVLLLFSCRNCLLRFR